MPKNLESYYQEAGRAGRDGQPADCILLFSSGDVKTAEFLIENSADNQALSPEAQAAQRKLDYQRLQDMELYCRGRNCLRAHILRYFGEGCADTCGHCGNCTGAFQEVDVTDQAELVLKTVISVENRYNQSFGLQVYAKLLFGLKDKVIGAWRMEELPQFGLLRKLGERPLKDLLEQMKLQALLEEHPDGKYKVLTLGPAAREVLEYGQQVRIRQKLEQAPAVLHKPVLPTDARDLLTALKRRRSQLSRQANVPSYVIFNDATLEDMARKRPTTLDQLLQVKGVGTVKAHRYGHEFLEVIRTFALE